MAFFNPFSLPASSHLRNSNQIFHPFLPQLITERNKLLKLRAFHFILMAGQNKSSRKHKIIHLHYTESLIRQFLLNQEFRHNRQTGPVNDGLLYSFYAVAAPVHFQRQPVAGKYLFQKIIRTAPGLPPNKCFLLKFC